MGIFKSYFCKVVPYSDDEGKRRTRKYRLETKEALAAYGFRHLVGFSGLRVCYKATGRGKTLRPK